MKLLVLRHVEVNRIGPLSTAAVMGQAEGKLECRDHAVGGHGGAWIYKVQSDEELDCLPAMSPVCNFSPDSVSPPAQKTDPGGSGTP